MRTDIRKDLQPTAGDLVAAGVRGLAGTVPFVADLLNIVFSSPLEKRKDEWMIQLADGLEELRKQVGEQDLEKLADNELFQTIVLDATNIAMRTHQEVKRKALCNACLNTARGININEDKQLIFIRLIDQLTDMDLRLLLYFENPLKRFEKRGENIETSFGMGGLTTGLYKFYPELKNQDEFVENRVKNLYSLGLMNTESINGIMSLNGVYQPRLTELGKEFISFIEQNA